jgi:hypothetical protein
MLADCRIGREPPFLSGLLLLFLQFLELHLRFFPSCLGFL